MKINKLNTSKFLLGAALAALIGGSMATSTEAQIGRRQSVETVAERQARTGITTFYYKTKSNAQGKYNAEVRRGKRARMYYENARREWAVDVENGLSSGTATTVTSTRTTTTMSADGGNLPNGANVTYFPTKETAEAVYKGALAQGDWAKMWYDKGRREYAVAIKVIPNGKGRRVGTTTTTTTTRTTTNRRGSTTKNGEISSGPGSLPNGATVLYFPTKDTAEGIYKASLKQGDWAKMWYDESRREWAVAVKPRL